MDGYEELLKGDGQASAELDTAPAAEIAAPPEAIATEPVAAEAPPPSPPALDPASPPPSPPQDPMAPIGALLDERERRKAAERRAAELEAWRADLERKRQEAAAQAPDILEDPQGYIAWAEQRQRSVVQQAVAQVQAQQAKTVEAISRNMMQRHLGGEQFDQLCDFIDAAPDRAHAIARQQPDPYGWFYEQFQKAQQARKAESALQALGDKSLDERVAEAVAAERAKWEAEHGGQTPAQPPANQPRKPNGKFDSTPQTQRHQPPSLSVVAAASAPRGEEARGGYEQLFKRG